MASGSIPKLGLVLSGGGSRAAYQAGVMKAVTTIRSELKLPIITGFSAGAINAAHLASRAQSIRQAALELVQFWSEIQPHQVFRTDPKLFVWKGLKLIWELVFGGIHRHTSTSSLLNTDPLNKFLSERIDFQRIKSNLESGYLESLAVAATDYGSSESVAFYDDAFKREPWFRNRRRALPVDFRVEHIMASAALPMLFPPVKVGQSYFGDGCLRNVAPLSSAVHLGAERLLIVGVRKRREQMDQVSLDRRPPLGRVLSVVMNAILLDTTDLDVERLERINQTLSFMSEENRAKSPLRPIDFVWITPSEDIGEIAKHYAKDLPWVVKYLLRGTGSSQEHSEISSYLLFEPKFCSRLIDLGYEDAMKQKHKLQALLDVET